MTKRKIKILFIPGVIRVEKGGAEMQMKILADNLSSKFEIYGIQSRDFAKFLYHKSRYYIYNKDKKIFRINLLFSIKIFEYISRIEPEIIYQRGQLPFLGVAAFYCKSHNCKLIWHIALENDVIPFRFELKKSVIIDYLNKKFLEYGIRRADCIIGQAKYQDELLKRNYGRGCDSIIPNFHPLPKKEIKKSEAPLRIVWVANFKRWKHPEIFIELAERFKNYEDVYFIMIGRPGEKKWQEKLEDRIDRIDNLQYLGERPIGEVNRILCKSHILVNTSRYEGFPNTFIQAWMRKVVAVSLYVDPDDILVKEGIGFRSGTIMNMAEQLKKLIDNRNLREKMGKKAQNYAYNNYSVEKNVNKIVNLLEDSIK